MPSPLPDQPGLLVRDPFRYSDVTLVVPPLLGRSLACFDGAHDEADLRALLSRLTGQVTVSAIAKQLVTALSDAGFLDDERFAALRDARERAFAAGDERAAAHAGSGYPDEPAALRSRLEGYYDAAPGDAAATATAGIAAPHVSPEGGYTSYAAAYRALPAEAGDRLFVVLGTSHYGEPDRFGLTRKPFATPFGVAPTRARRRRSAGGGRGRRRDAGGLLPGGRALDRVPGGVPAAPLRSRCSHRPGAVRPVLRRPARRARARNQRARRPLRRCARRAGRARGAPADVRAGGRLCPRRPPLRRPPSRARVQGAPRARWRNGTAPV